MTKKRLALVIGVLALVTIIGAVSVGAVLAQTDTPTTPSMPRLGRGFNFDFDVDFGFGMRGGGFERFDAVAEALNLTPTELFEQLHSGKTLSEIATDQGVDLDAVQEAMRGSRVQALKDEIAQAVTDGTITQEQADWLLEGIDKGWMFNGQGMGSRFGFDLGGHHGRGMRGMRILPFGNGGGTERTPSTPAPGTTF